MIEGINLWLAATNAWIVAPDGPGGECVIIDVPPEPDVILARLAEHELRLVALLGTHGHVDHVGGMGAVIGGVERSEPGRGRIPVHLHPGDHHMLRDPAATGSLGQFLDLERLPIPPPELVFGLDHGQKISGAGMTFTAIHTPGHTQGSTCFLMETEDDSGVLFTGDHLFAGSVGRTDLPGGSQEQLLASMAERILPLDDDILVLPGHGTTTTIGHERTTNPYLKDLGP